MKPSEPCSFPETIERLATLLNRESGPLLAFAAEDKIGGYMPDEHPQENRRWLGMSLYETEGQLLYAAVRALRPAVIVEVGSCHMCSTSHLAEAVKRNAFGHIHAIDPNFQDGWLCASHHPFITQHPVSVFDWPLPAEPIDFLYEDGSHASGFTRQVMERLLPLVRPGGFVACHDYCGWYHGPNVQPEFDAFFPAGTVVSTLVSPSECGLGFTLKP